MPRFHLNVHNSVHAIDADGAIFPDLETSKRSAIRGARELIADEILAGRPVSQGHRVEITDDDDRLLYTVYFGDLVQLRP